MKALDITGLLKMVDPALVQEYEARHLNRKTLRSVQAEYSSVKEDPMDEYMRWMNRLLNFMFFALGMTIVLCIKGDAMTGVAVFTVMSIPSALYTRLVVGTKTKRNAEIVARCLPILEDFEAAVEALNPLKLVIPIFSADSVCRKVLQDIAITILESESALRDLRDCGHKSAFRTRALIDYIDDLRDQLDTTLKHAAFMFGLKFSKSDLFVTAKEQLERQAKVSGAGIPSGKG